MTPSRHRGTQKAPWDRHTKKGRPSRDVPEASPRLPAPPAEGAQVTAPPGSRRARATQPRVHTLPSARGGDRRPKLGSTLSPTTQRKEE